MNVARTCSIAVGACVALSFLFAPAQGFSQDWKRRICERDEDNRGQGQDNCDATPFLSANVNSTSAESYHYTTDHTMTSRMFQYSWLGGPPSAGFYLYNSTNVENGLLFDRDGAEVVFPQEEARDYVTFIFSDFKGPDLGINFLAVNSSGQIIDEATLDSVPQDEFEVVTLGPHPNSGSSYDIQKVYMWHVDTSSCQMYWVEPVITEVRACDVRRP